MDHRGDFAWTAGEDHLAILDLRPLDVKAAVVDRHDIAGLAELEADARVETFGKRRAKSGSVAT